MMESRPDQMCEGIPTEIEVEMTRWTRTRSMLLSALVVALLVPTVTVAAAARPARTDAPASTRAAGPWSALGSNGAGDGALNGGVTTVVISGNDVYAGGFFSNAGGVAAADGVARWNGSTWSALGSNGAGDGAIVGAVYAMAMVGTDLYVGGSFFDVAGIASADMLARWNGTAWSAVGVFNGTFNDAVYALAGAGTYLYVGGAFTDAAGISVADHVVRWNGSQWASLGSNGAAGALDGDVWSLAALGPGVFVGGSFQDAGGVATADYVASWDSSTWAGLGSDGAGDGALDNDVFSVALATGHLYVGGQFSNAAGVATADRVAAWDGAAWSGLGSNGSGDGPMQENVFAVAAQGTNVYVGGDFANAGNVGAADIVAKWNGTTWSALGSQPPLEVRVNAFAVSSSGVYVGGQYTDAAGIHAADNIAKWALGGPRRPDGRVRLGTSGPFTGNDLYNVTGAGQTATGSAARGATITYDLSVQNDASTVAERFTVKATGAASANYTVTYSKGATDITSAVVAGTYRTPSLAPHGTHRITVRVTVGAGAAAGSSVSRLVVIKSTDDTTKKDAVKVIGKRSSGTLSLAGAGTVDLDEWILASDLMAGDAPRFERHHRPSTPAGAGPWAAVGPNGASPALNGGVGAILVSGTDLYVGGSFGNGGGIPAADYLAKWDGSSWSAVGGGGLNGSVSSLAMSGGDLYVGGFFHDVGGIPEADSVAKWNGTTWSALGSNGPGVAAIVGGVYAIATSGSDVFVGGPFDDAGGVAEADSVAMWDGVGWSALGSNGAGDGALAGNANALAVSGSDLYVGGGFGDAAGIAEADFIARWDGAAWSALGSGGAGIGALDASVFALAMAGSKLYVGGDFEDAAGIATADFVAGWDGSAWGALGSDGAGGGALDALVWSLATSGGDVYIGGVFNDVGGIATADNVARWDGSVWSGLGGVGDGALNSQVFAIAVSCRDLFVGGTFQNAAGIATADDLAGWTLGSPCRPDGRIRLGTTGAFRGNDVYGTSGAGQTRTGSAPRGATITYGVSVQNDGKGLGVFAIKAGGAATSQYIVKYFDGATDITAAVVAGTYQVGPLAPGSSHLLTVRVKVKSTAVAGSRVVRRVSVTSVTDTTRKDVVKLIAKRA